MTRRQQSQVLFCFQRTIILNVHVLCWLLRTTLNMDDSYFSSTFIDHWSWILLISPWTKARNTKALCYERESKLASVTWEQCWLYNSKPVSGEATEQPAAAEADQATQPWRGEGGDQWWWPGEVEPRTVVLVTRKPRQVPGSRIPRPSYLLCLHHLWWPPKYHHQMINMICRTYKPIHWSFFHTSYSLKRSFKKV